MELSVGAEIEIPIEKKYENYSKQIQLGASSLAIHGGAYFSAVCG